MKRFMPLFCILLGIVPASQAEGPANPKDYTAYVVGYAHIDLAWLWRWEESVHDIMFNTFLNQLNLMEKYPDFTFAQDQAVVFEMMERYYPEIYKQIMQRAKTHNWIPVSSTWVQMDENMPDGESLVRQFLYGQKFSKEKFALVNLQVTIKLLPKQNTVDFVDQLHREQDFPVCKGGKECLRRFRLFE